jgi:adenylate cyclase class IV
MDAPNQKTRVSTIEVETRLRQMSDEWVKAMVRADATVLDRILADDFYFTYPLEGDDKASVISDLTSGELKIEHFARDHVSVRIFASTAVLTARDAVTWLYHGREIAGQYKVLIVFAEREDRWQMCAIQACPMQQ